MFIYNANNVVPKDVTTVTIDASVTYVKVWAFQNCTELTTITIPPSVKHIGDSAFEGCTSLVSVNLPSSLIFLGDHVFQGCKSLLYINIPCSVSFIGDHAFYSCDALLSVITNYRDVFTKVKDRFCNHPLHDICSSQDVTVEAIASVIQGLKENRRNEESSSLLSSSQSMVNACNDRALIEFLSTDPWGFTPIHVLCCNSKATPEMIQLVIQHTCQEATMMKTTSIITPKGKIGTPLELYMLCKKDLNFDLPLCLGLKLGMKWSDVMAMMTVDGFDTLEQGRRDEITSFYPFMLAATHPLCDLEAVYRLALYNVNNMEPLLPQLD